MISASWDILLLYLKFFFRKFIDKGGRGRVKRVYFARVLGFIRGSESDFRRTMRCGGLYGGHLNIFRKRKLYSLHGLNYGGHILFSATEVSLMLLWPIPYFLSSNASIVHLSLQPRVLLDQIRHISIQLLVLSVEPFDHRVILLQVMPSSRLYRDALLKVVNVVLSWIHAGNKINNCFMEVISAYWGRWIMLSVNVWTWYQINLMSLREAASYACDSSYY